MAKETPAVKTRKTREAKFNRTQLTPEQKSLLSDALNSLENDSVEELENLKVNAPKYYKRALIELDEIRALRIVLNGAKFVSYSVPIAKEVAVTAAA